MPQIRIDTRQQAGKHVHVDKWFESHGIEYVYEKLDFGDYARADGFGNISCDTKKDVQEVAQNLGHDHARFVRECVRAKEAGYRLYVLVEQHPEYNDRELLKRWVSGVCGRCSHRKSGRCMGPETQGGRRCPNGTKPMQGQTVAAIMRTLESKYGVRFMFCDKRDTARIICELLGVEAIDGNQAG